MNKTEFKYLTVKESFYKVGESLVLNKENFFTLKEYQYLMMV